jgi:alkyl hydroperoxide reductase subunit AhpC
MARRAAAAAAAAAARPVAARKPATRPRLSTLTLALAAAALLIAAAAVAPQPAAAAIAGGILPPRSLAPDWEAQAVVDGDKITKISLTKDLLGNAKDGGWAVLCFIPLAFTFICPTELKALDELSDEFAKYKTSVAAISVDSVFALNAWNAADQKSGGLGGVTIPLVADVTKKIARDYGVLVEDPEDEMNGLALRAVFIVDPKRRVRAVQANDDNAGRSLAEVLRLVKAFQHADAHGEGCPANWEPGKETVVPTPEGSKAFFAKWAKGEA